MSYIPEKLFIVARKDKNIVVKNDTLKVRPAFIVPLGNEKFKASAVRWGRQYGNSEFWTFETTNDPVSGVRIVGLSKRAGGGRAYKVIYPTDFLVDLREDILLDAIYNVGIEAGGLMNGEYLWSVNGSQMRLIRTGSEAYNEIKLRGDLENLKRVPNKELKPGGIYVGKTSPPSLFVGFVSTLFIKPKWRWTYVNYAPVLNNIEIKKKKAMLWFGTYAKSTTPDRIINELDLYMQGAKSNGFPTIATGHTARMLLKEIPISPDVIFRIRDISRTKMLESVTPDETAHNGTQRLARNSPLVNMVPHGLDVMQHITHDYVRILEWRP